MSPRRRVLLSALNPVLIVLATLAAPAYAQFYDGVRGSLGFSLDAIERSPRLLGMGQLTYVGDDPHAAITLWDFAANPLGILLSPDTSSTLEFFPATSSYSGDHRSAGGATDVRRQVLAGREGRVSGEVWRRVSRLTAYGLAGGFGELRTDVVTGETIERRTSLGQPTVMPVMVGHLPFVKSDRWLYSARLHYSAESSVADYHATVLNPQGEFIDQTGSTPLDPPEVFTPTDYSVNSTGGGLGLGYDRGEALRVALAVDRVEHDIEGRNEAYRHTSETREKRPYAQGQITLVGRLAGLQWGVDGREWRSASEQSWYFTTSSGPGADPLTGRGKLLEREEDGQGLRARLRWARGPLELGGGVATRYQKITITPPLVEDLTSFNYFLNVVSLKQSADSLSLPDSVVRRRVRAACLGGRAAA